MDRAEAENCWLNHAVQVEIQMTAEAWAAFMKVLDGPPRCIPALKKLLTEPSVFDTQWPAGLDSQTGKTGD